MRSLTIFAAAAALALAACGPATPGSIDVRDGTIAAPVGVHGVSAGYFTLQNNGPADTLLSVSTPVAATAEMHETVNEDGMLGMRRLDKVDLPAGGIVSFAPGGKHLMLMGVKPDAVPGRSVTVTLTFAKAGAKEYAFVITQTNPAH